MKTHLSKTHLMKTHLIERETCLTKTNLTKTRLTKTHLTKTYLTKTHLTKNTSYKNMSCMKPPVPLPLKLPQNLTFYVDSTSFLIIFCIESNGILAKANLTRKWVGDISWGTVRFFAGWSITLYSIQYKLDGKLANLYLLGGVKFILLHQKPSMKSCC